MADRVPPPGLVHHPGAGGGSVIREALTLSARPDVLSFAGGLPASESIDAEGLRAAFDQVLSESPHTVLQYSVTDGDRRLREAIADRLTGRGLLTDPDRPLVTTGAQQALALLAAVLLRPGDTVAVEEPTYLAALQCFARAGARVIPVPTDDDGIEVEALAHVVDRERPRLVYLVPNFQNPTGRTLSLERRRAVARLAGEKGFWIAEDDPYGDLRFRGQHLPWVTAQDGAQDRSILIGSLSKILAPGLRLGWIHAPLCFRRACVVAKQAMDLHSSTVDQAAAAHYLATHDIDTRLEHASFLYRERCDAMLAALPEALPEGSTWSHPDGGMFLWVRLPGHVNAEELLPQAVSHGVAYVPGAPFFAGPPDRSTLRLSFAGHNPANIEQGMKRLGKAFT
ncbi:PLP-dependent aminotransferase family protein [Streptomyces sp. NPDC048301]|uniref:aminotransferase-like domain-containing protein n=1 Tax=Streptomyces sp. NPDC048301 TaxID=3155631 RepID=UPI003441970F